MRGGILNLVVTTKWYNEIASEKKRIEYRDWTAYWRSRFLDNQDNFIPYHTVIFRRGYTPDVKYPPLFFTITSIILLEATLTLEIHFVDKCEQEVNEPCELLLVEATLTA